jgi:hypothetical protein
MIRDEELLPLLATAKEGDMITAGKLLKGVSPENIAWVVIEVVHMHNKTRITLHAYWHDIFIISKVVNVIDGTKIIWGVTTI